MKGWVYIITNKSMPNLLNIGFSNNDPALKAEELNKSEIPHPYVIEYDALVNEPKEIAQKIQAILSHCHENKGWFRCDVAKAIIAIRQAAADSIIVENNRNAEVKKPEIRKAELEPEKVAAKSLDIQDLYAAVIGDKNTDYYLAKFAEFDQQKPGLKPSWNWSAFLFNSAWLLYRKMYGWFFAYCVVVSVFTEITTITPNLWLRIVALLIIFVPLFFADSLYHERVKKKIAVAQQTIKNEAKLLEFLQSGGGVHNWVVWFGWSLPVVAVIGIVASIVIPAMYPTNKTIAPSPSITANVPQVVTCEKEIKDSYDDVLCFYTQSSECEYHLAQMIHQYLKAAEQGCVYAQDKLGNAYNYGKGVVKDEAQAMFWYSKAAEQGYIKSQYSLGLMYGTSGTMKDDTQSVFWYRKAADQGHAGAMDLLGYHYEKGEGVVQDTNIAREWYRKSVEINRVAAEKGDLSAQSDLAESYLDGKGITKDKTQAIFWFRKAAEQGDASAQDALRRLGQ